MLIKTFKRKFYKEYVHLLNKSHGDIGDPNNKAGTETSSTNKNTATAQKQTKTCN